MKKLLAIAVAVAFAAPAMADTSVYGSARMLLGDDNLVPTSKLTLKNNSSRIGLKGSNALNNGLSMTHKIELGIDPVNNGGVSNRSSYIGLKGGFGEVRFGSDWTPLDNVDDGAGVLTNNGERLQNTDGTRHQSIKYLGKFGPVGVLASFRPNGNNTGLTPAATPATVHGGQVGQAGATKYQLGVTYEAGPIYAGIGTGKVAGAGRKAPLVVALAYNGANYRVGFTHAKDHGGVKSNGLGGKYSFGNAYVAAQYTKRKATTAAAAVLLPSVVLPSVKLTDLELGYKLGKGTKVYFQHKETKFTGAPSVKSNDIGVQHDF